MDDADGERLSVILFGSLMAVNFVLSAVRADLYPAVSSLMGIGLTALPWALRRRGLFALPWALTALTGAVTFLHAAGILLSLYDLVWWWDIMTHLLASVVIASGITVGILVAEERYRFLRLPPKSFPALVVAAVILSGVVWEVLEFSFDGLLGMHMQYSLDDTATDLSFDILGGAIVALMVPFYLPRLREGLERGSLGPGA